MVKLEKRTQQKRRKKVLLLISTLTLFCGGIAIGVYTLMNSPQMKTLAILEKVQKFKKAEGTFSADGTVMRPSFLQAITADAKLHGTYTMLRNHDQNHYAKMDANVHFSGNTDTQKIIEDADVNGDYSIVLTKTFELQWQGKNKRGSHLIAANEQKILADFFDHVDNPETEEQKALKELQAFLVKGYIPDVTSEGNKTIITIDKAKLDNFIENAGKNIAANSAKFEDLVKKTKIQIQNSDIESVIKNAQTKTLQKQFKAFTGLEKFQCKISYEDLGQTIKQSIELKTTIKHQRDMAIDVKINLRLDVLFHL